MNQLKSLSLKLAFICLSGLIVFLVLGIISYFLISKPNETFLSFISNFMIYSIGFMTNVLLVAGVVFVMMHYLTKLYKKFFPN